MRGKEVEEKEDGGKCSEKEKKEVLLYAGYCTRKCKTFKMYFKNMLTL